MQTDLKTKLPESLNNPNDLPRIQRMITQWSRLVAWSWTPCLAFSGDDKVNIEKASQEQKLKVFFSKTLKEQAMNKLAFEAYGVQTSKIVAERLSQEIKHLVLGQNDQIDFLRDNNITVTLSEITQKLTGLNLISTEDPIFGGMFIYNVVLSKFTGELKQVVDEQENPVVPRQYYAEVGYPPTPAFNEATVTELQLSNWVHNINTGEDYLPPSPYIAFGFC
jgi:hypothetical protein